MSADHLGSFVESCAGFFIPKKAEEGEIMAKTEFKSGVYEEEINVRDFIQRNYTPYEGDAAFLSGSTARTAALMEKVNALLKAGRARCGYGARFFTADLSGGLYRQGKRDHPWLTDGCAVKARRQSFRGDPYGASILRGIRI